MSELWKKINYWKKNCFEICEKQEKRAFYSVFVLFLSFLHSLLIFWPIFTFIMAIESYGHVDYTCFIHFEKSQKIKALGQFFFLNPEPPNLWLYPLIHSISPFILKWSNFQVSYHFGKVISSNFNPRSIRCQSVCLSLLICETLQPI